jgi:hypothetical protein
VKVLLDECLPVDYRHSFPNHEVHSVEWAGLKGKKNGQLLTAAEQAGYHVFVTVDRSIRVQQNFLDRRLAVVIVVAPTNQLEDLVPLAPIVAAALVGQILMVP